MIRFEYLKLEGHPQLGNLELNLSEENEIKNKSKPYTTVIIGQNGTGKSYILRTLIDLFREMYELKKYGKRKKYVVGNYCLVFHLNGFKYCYRNIHDPVKDGKYIPLSGGAHWRERGMAFYIERNGSHISPQEIELPGSLLASSIMLTDKYIFLSNPEEFPIYKYLGIRATRSTAGTRSYIKNTINFLANSTEKNIFIDKLPNILKFLDLEEYLILRYSVRRKDTFFTNEISKETFAKFIKEYEHELQSRREKEEKNIIPWFAYRHYLELLKDDEQLNTLIDFCNNKSQELKQNDDSGNFFFEYDLIKDLSILEKEIASINLLEKLNLIGYPELSFKKKGSPSYNYEGASSGEAHILSSMIGILATIKENSIVLIDEPEISLHPNWQMKYMSLLNDLFKSYTNCHFVIASHSHFLISDLQGENSKIIGLKRENGNIEIVELPINIDTYGWSAEDVLYNVFNVVSTRNKFVAEDISRILNDLSLGKGNMINKLPMETYNKIINLESALKESDPLKSVVKSILNHIK